MSVVIDGTLGITTPAETVQGALTTTGNTILGDASTDTLNVGNGGLVKDASGNVGIGTTSPGALLHVGTTTAKIRIGATAGIEYLDISRDSATGNMIYNAAQASYGAHNFQIAGTEQARIDPAGLFKFNSGYGSAATAYGCRAWVNFNGTGTVAIRASGNVSSITDTGTGDYTVNFTTAIVDINYSISAYSAYSSTSVAAEYNLVGDCIKLVGSLRIVTGYVSSLSANLTLGDRLVNDIAIFR